MFEYFVHKYGVPEAADYMNALAKEGWRVIAVSPDIAKGFGVIVTFEREIKQ